MTKCLLSAQAFQTLSTKRPTIYKTTHHLLSVGLIIVVLVLSMPIGHSLQHRHRFATGWDEKAELRWVETTLRSLSLRERIGQMVMIPVQVDFMNQDNERFASLARQIDENKLGGIIVRSGSPTDVALLTNELQKRSRVPLFVAADYERGLRMQMKNGTPFTNNMGVAAAGEVDAAYRQGRITAEEMRAIGVNWSFGPVADLNNNPDNPVINVRSFGEDPKRVGEFVVAAVKGLRDGGVMATAKHFPGHGDTAIDTHIGLAKIKADRARLDRLELLPFKAAINAGVDSIMTAHVAVPDLTGDDLPASLSKTVTTDILRRELKFGGLIITDSLGMGAITKAYPGGEAAVMAIKAGSDLALSPPDPQSAIEALEAAVKRGEIKEARINQSVERILHAKFKLGLATERTVDPSTVTKTVERPQAMETARSTAERSITLLRNANNMFPLRAASVAGTTFVVVAADDDPEEGRTFIPQIKKRFAEARVLRVDPRTSSDEYDAITKECSKAEAVVVAAFVKRAAGKGTVALPEKQAELVRRIIASNRQVGVIAFSGPYLIKQFPDAGVYATAYAIEDIAQAAAVRVLFGEAPFEGRLPVSVPGLFALGAGIQVKVK